MASNSTDQLTMWYFVLEMKRASFLLAIFSKLCRLGQVSISRIFSFAEFSSVWAYVHCVSSYPLEQLPLYCFLEGWWGRRKTLEMRCMALSSLEYQEYEKVVTLFWLWTNCWCFSPILRHLNHEKGKLSLTVSKPSYHTLSTLIIMTTVWLSLGPIFFSKKFKSKNLLFFFLPLKNLFGWCLIVTPETLFLSFRKETAFLLRMAMRLKNFKIIPLLIYWEDDILSPPVINIIS